MAHDVNLPSADTADLTNSRANADVSNQGFDRRRFLGTLGIAGAAVASTCLLAGCGDAQPVVAAGTSEIDVLNFALNLEYLEATMYSYVLNGSDLPSTLTGGGTVSNPPTQLTGLSQQTVDILSQIYFDEISHVADLRSLLGSQAVSRPNLNFSAVTPANALSVARLAEDLGVTAYAGAATLLSSANLQAAAQILGVEGFHAGALRVLSIQLSAPYPTALRPADGYDIPPVDPGSKAAAQAGPTLAGGIFATASSATTAQPNTFPGLAYRRTTSQVLAVVYGGGAPGASAGGFFPNGVNGNIKTV